MEDNSIKINGFIVFKTGYDEGIEGMVQLSNRLGTYKEAKEFSNSWKRCNTYVLASIEEQVNPTPNSQ